MTKTNHLILPCLEKLADLFTVDESSTSGLRWKNPSKFSKMKSEDVAGRKTHEGYWRVKINCVDYTVHRIIYYMQTGVDPGAHMIDHIKDKQNNFLIRLASNSQNQANKRKLNNCSSAYKGVSYYSQHKKFKAGIMVEGSTIHLGYFTEEIEAAKAYNKAAIKYFGEYALLNDLQESVDSDQDLEVQVSAS